MNRVYDVIVVGAGPVGLFLACELRLQGAKVIVLESEAEDANSPLKEAPLGVRGLSVATAETLYRRGLLAELKARAPSAKDKRGGHFAGIAIDFANVDESRWIYRLDGPGSQAMGATLKDIEHVLRKRARQLGAEFEFDFHASSLEQNQSTVSVSSDSRKRTAKWLVGCDGGRSQVRKLAGFEFVGTEAEFTAYAALVKIREPNQLKLGRVLTSTGFYMQPMPGYVSVMEFDGGAFDRRNGISREHFQSVLSRVAQTDITIDELTIATSYTDRAKLTTKLQQGRVLLAGDAAHIHSPLGGQGLNVGIGDAFNLGWKLAAAVNNEQSSLLQTYFNERHPVAEWVVDWTRAQAALLKPDKAARAQRAIMTNLINTKDGATYFAEKLWSVNLQYDLGSGTHPLVGRSCPDFELNDGTRLGAHLDDGKALVILFGAQKFKTTLKHLEANPMFNLHALLVRPDGVIAWVAEKSDDFATLQTEINRWSA